MQGKSFLYFAQNLSGQFATYTNNFLEWTSTPTPLEFTPDGWEDLSILTEKNKKYFALDRTYGAPQNFVEDAAGILKTIFYTYGEESTLFLTILEQKLYFSATEYGYYYDLLTKCEIDLSTYKHDGAKVNVSMMDGELSKMFKANETQIFDIDLDAAPEAVPVLNDGVKLFATAHYVNPAGSIPSVPGTTMSIPWVFTSKEGDQVNILNQSADLLSPLAFLESVKGVNNVRIEGHITFQCSGSTGINIVLNKVKISDGSVITTINNWHFNNNGVTNDIPFSYDVTLNEGEGLLFTYVNTPDSSTTIFAETKMDATYQTKLAPTLVKALKAIDLYKRLVSKVTDGKYEGVSTLLETMDPYCLFSSGDGVRLIPGAFIKTSIADFFAFINMRFNAALGIINGKLALEKKEYWANDTNIIALGEVSSLVPSSASSYLVSSFSIGYPNKLDNAALGNINGKYEFCMTHKYSTPIKRVNQPLDLTCKYVAGMYAIENTRLNSQGKTTTDGDTDNDVIVYNTLSAPFDPPPITVPLFGGGSITIDEPPYWVLDRTLNPYASGLLDNATAFNIRLSPKQCVIAQGSYLRSCMRGVDDKKIVLTSADKDVALVVTPPTGDAIEERGSIEVSRLAAPLFKPVQFEMHVRPPSADLLANPLRKFSFTYPNGITGSGFDIKTGTAPADDRQQVFQLLCGPEVDLTQFIDIWQ